MTRLHRALFVLMLASAAAACDDGPSAPSSTPPPTTTPTPPVTTPPAPTFRVTGSIMETAPTEGRPVENAQVSLSNGPSVTSAGDGSFTLTGVAAGTYTLTVAKADFTSTTRSVTVSSSDVAVPRINLAPAPGVVSSEYLDRTIGPEEQTCHGTSRSCDTYPFNPHHDGRIEVQLLWETDATELDIEVRCSDEVVAESYRKGGTMEELNEFVPGGRPCEVQVLHSGDPTNYRVFIKHPR